MADQDTITSMTLPTLEELQHWTSVMGRAQQMMLEFLTRQVGEAGARIASSPSQIAAQWPGMGLFADPAKIAQAQVDLWTEGMAIWQRALGGAAQPSELAD